MSAATTTWVTAAFVRGGTSKGLFFTEAELPLALPGVDYGPGAGRGPGADHSTDTEQGAGVSDAALVRRDAVLCAALGSPDPFGRQLDGMGGGVSSLSKAMIVGRSQRPGIDLDYTFAQVPVDGAAVDYSGNCGNLSAGVVPFALATGIAQRSDGPQHFTLFNVNTGKTVAVRLTVVGGLAATRGQLALPGVAGAGSPIDLVYPSPGGSRTAGVLPTGEPTETLSVSGRKVRASIVDAAIPLVIVAAGEVGLTGAESPAEIEAQPGAMRLLDGVRRAGAVRAGLCASEQSAPLAVPKVVVVAPPAAAVLLDGTVQPASEVDVLARTISMERVHGAVPGTGAMCLAAAALIPGTVVHKAVYADTGMSAETQPEATDASAAGHTVGAGHAAGTLRIGTPSGAVTASAVCERAAGQNMPHITETALARTARILMRGEVALELG